MKGQGLEQALFFNLVFYFSDSVTLLVGLGLGLANKQLDLDSDLDSSNSDRLGLESNGLGLRLGSCRTCYKSDRPTFPGDIQV